MYKRTVIAILAVALAACGEAVERAAWQSPSFRGKPFWPLFPKLTHDSTQSEPDPSVRGLEDLPISKEYASVLNPRNHTGIPEFRRAYNDRFGGVEKDPVTGKPFYAVRVPDEKRFLGKYTLRHLAGGDYGDYLYEGDWSKSRLYDPQKDSPFLMTFGDSRPAYFLPGKLNADREDFLKWKAAHPNFIGFYAMGEIDSDTGNYVASMTDKKGYMLAPPDPEAKAIMMSRFPPPKDRWEWFENLKRVWAKELEFHFGEDMFWPLYCNNCSLAHMNAALGAVGLLNETSSSCGAPFAFSGIYTRGASRQWGIPFAWYCACYYRGFFRDGRESKSGTWTNKWPRDGVFTQTRPAYKGSSRSLMHRQQTYGWLIGAAMIQDEGWGMHHVSATNGVPCPSPYAADMNRLFVRSQRMDRGASFTPVAFLAPMTESFHRQGRAVDSGNGCNANLPAWMLTLVPIRETDEPEGGLHSRRKHGDEGCLFNSPYGDFVDVLAPDSGLATERFSKVLDHYSMAILMGTYRKGELDVAALESFVRRGGELVVSSDYVEEGLVPESLAGMGFDGRVASGQELRNAAGATVERLNGAYSLAKAVRVDKSAAAVLSDENGAVVAFSRPLGEGRVVTLTPKRGMPSRYLDLDKTSKQGQSMAGEIRSGRGELGLIRHVLDDAQDRFVPVKVEGDVFWGLSRTANGWFLWLMNNKGVAKYAGEPADIDFSKTAEVKVNLRTLAGLTPRDADTGEPLPVADGAFVVKVGPGGLAFVQIEKRSTR